MKRQRDNDEYVEPSEILFGKYFDKFVEAEKNTVYVSAASEGSYKDTAKRIQKYALALWEKPLTSVDSLDIKKTMQQLVKAGLSDRTCEITLIHVRACLKQAVKDRMVARNVAAEVKAPSSHKSAVREIKVLTNEEYDKVMTELKRPMVLLSNGKPSRNEIESKTHRDCILFMLKTGIRIGEARALRWEDVDLKKKMAYIHASIDRNKEISLTKNKEADEIPLDDDLIEMLIARSFRKMGFVFTNRMEKPLNLKNAGIIMKRITGYSPHTCRKTFTTRGARAGVDPKVLQSLTRHKDIHTLYNHYRAVDMSDKRDALAKISSGCKAVANIQENSDLTEKAKTPETLQSQGS